MGGLDSAKDWMRRFVGVVRPLATKEYPLRIISFNYDYLLERAMKMYWPGSEQLYAKIEDAVEFIYPHGRLAELPDEVLDPQAFISRLATNLRVGENADTSSRARAREVIAESDRIFSVGFSFSDTNVRLLGLDMQKMSVVYVQNYENKDLRLARKLSQWQLPQSRVDPGDMNTLVMNGFFEQ